MENYFQALDYYKQSLVLKENANNLVGVAIMLNNIANVHHKMNVGTKVLSFYRKALEIVEAEKSVTWKSTLLENIG